MYTLLRHGDIAFPFIHCTSPRPQNNYSLGVRVSLGVQTKSSSKLAFNSSANVRFSHSVIWQCCRWLLILEYKLDELMSFNTRGTWRKNWFWCLWGARAQHLALVPQRRRNNSSVLFLWYINKLIHFLRLDSRKLLDLISWLWIYCFKPGLFTIDLRDWMQRQHAAFMKRGVRFVCTMHAQPERVQCVKSAFYHNVSVALNSGAVVQLSLIWISTVVPKRNQLTFNFRSRKTNKFESDRR